jgi:dihydrofolate synthase/folylpolyglutamate synthase
MRFQTLAEWLNWQESLHPTAIELGLERPGAVLHAMELDHPDYTVITVAGTNGKGSSVAMLEAILRCAGYRVGCYTSPHLLRYNERIRIDGDKVSDERLCQAFERVDQARGEISLTYFEFGTLAALDIFASSRLDAVVLEVGMGGRLDAVNLIDPDCALVTAIDIDHSDWLGSDRETIAREKAGIFRTGKPAVCSDTEPPLSLIEYASQLNSPLHRIGHEYGYRSQSGAWTWWGGRRQRDALPLPALRGQYQLQNAAGILMVLELLQERLPVNQQQIREGLQDVALPGRFQVIPGEVTTILDVAHNPQAAQALAENLVTMTSPGRTHAVVAMLADKDIGRVIAELKRVVDCWYVAGLDVPRGAQVEQIEKALQSEGVEQVEGFRSVQQAMQAAQKATLVGERIVVFGSFYTVAIAHDLIGESRV